MASSDREILVMCAKCLDQYMAPRVFNVDPPRAVVQIFDDCRGGTVMMHYYDDNGTEVPGLPWGRR